MTYLTCLKLKDKAIRNGHDWRMRFFHPLSLRPLFLSGSASSLFFIPTYTHSMSFATVLSFRCVFLEYEQFSTTSSSRFLAGGNKCCVATRDYLPESATENVSWEKRHWQFVLYKRVVPLVVCSRWTIAINVRHATPPTPTIHIRTRTVHIETNTQRRNKYTFTRCKL